MSFLSPENITLVYKMLCDYLPEHYYARAELKADMAEWLRTYKYRGLAGSRGFLERANTEYVKYALLNSYPRDHVVDDGQLKIRPDPSWYNNYGRGYEPGSALSKMGGITLGNLRVADYCSPSDAYFMLHSLSRGKDPQIRKPMVRPECVGRCAKWLNCPCGKQPEACYDDELVVQNPSTRPKYGDLRKFEFPRQPRTFYDIRYKVDFDSSNTLVGEYDPPVYKPTVPNYRRRLLNML